MAERHSSERVIPHHISAFDGLRALAVIAVILHHCGAYYLQSGSVLKNCAEALWTGVDLFFALSGFLITGILLDSLGKPYFFKRFYWRRGLRIWPLYYAFLLAVFLFHRGTFSGIGMAPFALYYRNFLGPDRASDIYIGQFWSLCVEEQFYLIWPLVIYYLPSRLRVPLVVLLLSATLFFRIYLEWHGTDSYLIYRLPVCHMDPLLTGAAVAMLTRRGTRESTLRKVCWIATGAGLIGFMFVWSRLGGRYLQFPVTLTSSALLFGGTVGLCSRGCGRIGSVILGSSFLRAVSIRSYAMYVFHLVPLYISVAVLRRLNTDPRGFPSVFLLILGVGLVTYVLAWLSWRYFEEPILRLKKWEWFATTPMPASSDTHPTA